MKFSVVIPTHNEGAQIGQVLKRLRQISPNPMEVILVDGGSDDGTPAIAEELADTVISHKKRNRGAQLDAGAKKASGDLLLFLRPDAQLPGTWQQVLEHFWLLSKHEGVAATAFTVQYGTSLPFRVAARLSNARVSVREVVGGDHALCTTPENYRRSGGFPHFPVLEDVVISKRLKALGDIVLLPEVVWPAARRLHQAGLLRLALEHAWTSLRFKLGTPPEELAR